MIFCTVVNGLSKKSTIIFEVIIIKNPYKYFHFVLGEKYA